MYSKDIDLLSEHAALLDAMGNAYRLRLLSLISKREWKVGDLANELGISQSALSQHLNRLRSKKLVTTRRDAQVIYYSCKSPGVLQVLSMLKELGGEAERNAEKPGGHQE